MNKATLTDVMERVRKHVVCAYVGDICDCKYGADDLPTIDQNRLTWNRYGGEQNGCCEMREMIWLLKNMTDKEYERIVKRGNREAARRAKLAFQAKQKEL